MVTAQQFGMTEEEFERAMLATGELLNGMFEQGGYPAIDREYQRLKAVEAEGGLTGLEAYRLMVITNILVMA